MKRGNKRRKKQSLLKRRFLRIPVWIWLIIFLIGAAVSGDSPQENTTLPVEPTATIAMLAEAAEVTEEPVIFAETPVPTYTPEPTPAPAPTEVPTAVPTVTPQPTKDLTSHQIKKGDKGEEVKQLQTYLIRLGFLSDKVDGVFGANTEKAVAAYQKAAGLQQTGICDYDTYLSMMGDNPATAAPKKVEEPLNSGTDYIYNKNTKKFHYPGCNSVKQMKDSNKGYFTGSRNELINRGYDPCKNCNP